MNITPLAADSMGVRSSATLVETADHRILIDPSAALAPNRFDLPPTEIEIAALAKFKNRINSAAKKADVIIISHYHHDHFDPEADYYKDKQVYVKSWERDINYSQRERGARLHKKLKKLGVLSNVGTSDGTRHVLESGLNLWFSPAVPHGPVGTKIGYVVMTTVDDGNFRFMHCSDVSGPVETATAHLIIASEPDLVYIDGPPTHLLNTHFSEADLEKAINNILDIISLTRARVILDHHLMRDRSFREQMGAVYDRGERVVSAAEFLGQRNDLLEATRNELLEKVGDSHE